MQVVKSALGSWVRDAQWKCVACVEKLAFLCRVKEDYLIYRGSVDNILCQGAEAKCHFRRLDIRVGSRYCAQAHSLRIPPERIS